ncbi:MAG TPA: hypothetical protein VF868_13340 [Bacteroidia bacterium]
MKKITFVTITIAVMLLAFGCKKTKLTGSKEMYEGYWTSSTTISG